MSFDLRRRRRAPHFARGDAFALLELEQRLFARRGVCMLQHDMDVANGSGATVRADFNNAIEALATVSSGATEPGTTYAYQFWADTTAGLLKQRNAANTAWEVRDTLAETLAVARSSNTILAAGDYKKFFRATASFTQTLTAAATLGDGWWAFYRVDSGATVTFDPNASETIDGATTKAVVGPASGIIFCDGSNFYTYGYDFPLASQAEMEAGSSVAVAVTPGRQHYHPSAAKAWVNFTGTGTVTINQDYGVSSITDAGTGTYTVNLDTNFSAATYCVAVSGDGNTNTRGCCNVSGPTIAVGSFQIICADGNTGSVQDHGRVHASAFGDQ